MSPARETEDIPDLAFLACKNGWGKTRITGSPITIGPKKSDAIGGRIIRDTRNTQFRRRKVIAFERNTAAYVNIVETQTEFVDDGRCEDMCIAKCRAFG